MRIALLGVLLALPVFAYGAPDEKPLVIHEWGTFTSLQDENGRTIGGVNIDDEPVPAFVHRLGERPKNAPHTFDDLSKSFYPGSPSVTMRLETPVLYFYPADDKPVSIDITATFKGGLVSEYFPNGETFLNGKPSNRKPEVIRGDGVGAITWKNVTINAKGEMPRTDEHVWLAPRKVASAPISVGAETEQYIFYRGVGNLDAPLTARRGRHETLNIATSGTFKPGAMWLADFRTDGSCAFVDATLGGNLVTFKDYSTENVAKLRASMKRSLVSAGLFEDEAEAMLETWKLSYFKSSGQRLFYMVPQAWTDAVLPLEMSKPAQVTRVMIGRLELVTPAQRLVINQVTDETNKPTPEVKKQLTESLGRFGQSLVNDQYRRQQAAAREARARAAAK